VMTFVTAATERLNIDSGSTKPAADNTYFLGTGSNRWKEIFAANGTINTSDANEKQQIRSLEDKEKEVAQKLKGLVKAFKFNEAVEKKGDEARIHVGWIVQEVIAAFEEVGLDAFKYSMVCKDEIEGTDQYRYGLRHTEVLAFIVSAL